MGFCLLALPIGVAAAFESETGYLQSRCHAHGPRTDVAVGRTSSAIPFLAEGRETSVSAIISCPLHRLPLRAEFLDRGQPLVASAGKLADITAMP